MSGTLYHYTEYVALDGILNKGVMHLNNILTMNDASEMRFFITSVFKEVYRRLKSDHFDELAVKTEKFMSEEMQDEYYYAAYAACFSGFRDDAAQWDRYGRHGQGVCIGFDEKCMKKLMGGSVSLQCVYYDENPSRHPLTDKIYAAITRKEIDVEVVRRIMNEIWMQSSAYKHPSFASENEIRLVVSPFIDDQFAVEPQYKISQNRIKKYYPLNLKEICQRNGMDIQDLVTEIIIGPTSTQPKELLIDYFRDHGMERIAEKVVYSCCPLKNNASCNARNCMVGRI